MVAWHGIHPPGSCLSVPCVNLPCDSFVTIGLKDSVAGDETTLAPCQPGACDWDSPAFNNDGLIDGFWFNFVQTNGQGDAGEDLQVLIIQASMAPDSTMSGTVIITWKPADGAQVFPSGMVWVVMF